MLPLQIPLWRETPISVIGVVVRACSSKKIEKSDSPVGVCLSRRVWPQYSSLEVEGKRYGTSV